MNTVNLKIYVLILFLFIFFPFQRLHKQGARTFWIHNTGPIGCLPFEVLNYLQQHENVDQNGCLRSLNEIAQEFNRQLKDSVIQLRMQFPGAALTYVDIYSAKYSLISDAKHHGKLSCLLIWFPRPNLINDNKPLLETAKTATFYNELHMSFCVIHLTPILCCRICKPPWILLRASPG